MSASAPTIVIGAGVVGVLTAYHLARSGLRVMVVDSEPGPAEGTSFANAGVVAVGHTDAWASPAALLDLACALVGRNPAVQITRLMDPALWRWGLGFLANCTDSAYRANSAQLLKGAQYSASVFADMRAAEKIDCYWQDNGAIYFYQRSAQFQKRCQTIALDSRAAELFEVLTPQQLITLEPAFGNMRNELAGAILSRSDISGDCRLFTTRLATKLAESGDVVFHYGVGVNGIRKEGQRVHALRTSAGDIDCSGVVIAAGNGTPQLLREVGLSVPVYPVKGYSATYRITDAAKVPSFGAVDETALVSFARYGDRFRLTSTAEFAGNSRALTADRIRGLDNYASRMFGSGLSFDGASYWAGLRPSTPMSTPFVGQIKACDNLWVNAGHGQLGWTLSAGTGRIIADLVSGRQPQVSGVSATANWLEAC